MIRLRAGRFGLDFDRDYGIDRRTGWSCVWNGSVHVQLVSLPRALGSLLLAWWRDPGDG